MSTLTQLEGLNQHASDIRKAIRAGYPERARQLLEEQAKRSTGLHDQATVVPETEVTDFVSKHMGTHGPGREELTEFQRAADDVYFLGVMGGFIKHRRSGTSDDDVVAPRVEVDSAILQLKAFQRMRMRYPKLCQEGLRVAKAAKVGKALYSTGAAVGDEWVPTNHSPTLEDAVRLEANVATLFRRIDMPSNPFVLPVRGNLPNMVILTEVSTDSASVITRGDAATANLTLTATKFGLSVIVSEEFKEDSIIAVLPWLRDELAQMMAHGLDSAILDGDTTADHRDSDVTTTSDRRAAWDGLRETAEDLSTTQIDGSTFTLALLRNVRAAMGVYGANPGDLAYITSVSGAMRIMGLSQVATLDTFGPNATVLRGQITNIDGIPVIVSQDCRQNLNASGVYDSTTTTNTIVVVVNRRSWVLGQRRGVTLRAFPDARRDQDELVATGRWAFSSLHTRGTETNVGVVYGIANAG